MQTNDAYPGRFCPCCSRFVAGSFRPGPGGRPDAGCPHCGSLERQRFLAVLLATLEPTLKPIGNLLDIAPSTLVTPMLERLHPQQHLRVDLGADPRLVDCYASLTELPLPDDSIDFLICYHVLEHIPDDRSAMRELARVLAPGGLGLVQVPWRPDADTDEDPSASEEERLRRFGQADHVRWYGRDLEQRLMESGLGVRRVTPRMLLGDAMCQLLRLNPVEAVWLISADSEPYLSVGRDGDPSNLVLMLDALVTRLARERVQRDRARARVARLRKRVETGDVTSRRNGVGRLATRLGRRVARLPRSLRRGA